MNEPTGLVPRLGIHLRNFAPESSRDWNALIDLAQAADRAGVDSVIVSDHVVFGEQLDDYGKPSVGGIAGGAQPTGPDGSWLEPLTLLAFIAGSTARVRLTTHILLAALRRPVVLAKTLATLDVLSHGRLDVGVGVGWQAAEYSAAGLDFADRGRLLDETLTACQTLWREQSATIEVGGQTVASLHQMPKPVQPGGVPLWISGRINQRVVNRLARFGTGWIPWGDHAALLRTSVPTMLDLVDRAGGDPNNLRIVGGLPNVLASDGVPDPVATMHVVPELRRIGVTDFIVRVPSVALTGDVEAELGRWVAAFAQATGR